MTASKVIVFFMASLHLMEEITIHRRGAAVRPHKKTAGILDPAVNR